MGERGSSSSSSRDDEENASHDRLLASDEHLGEHECKDPSHAYRKERLWNRRAILTHVAIAASYILLLSALVPMLSPKSSSACNNLHAHAVAPASGDFYSPAKEALEYEDTVMSMDPKHFADGNPFVGDPREELDQAWDGLLENIQISLTADEFSQVRPQLGDNRSTLVLPDGGHIVRFRVYHELHCLKWIRKWMHREHYWPDLTGYALHERRWHIEHCLEEFRMHAMCHPSLAPATFYFLDRKTSDEITADGTHVEKCVNWDSLQKWTGERRVDLNTVDRKALVEGG